MAHTEIRVVTHFECALTLAPNKLTVDASICWRLTNFRLGFLLKSHRMCCGCYGISCEFSRTISAHKYYIHFRKDKSMTFKLHWIFQTDLMLVCTRFYWIRTVFARPLLLQAHILRKLPKTIYLQYFITYFVWNFMRMYVQRFFCAADDNDCLI